MGSGDAAQAPWGIDLSVRYRRARSIQCDGRAMGPAMMAPVDAKWTPVEYLRRVERRQLLRVLGAGAVVGGWPARVQAAPHRLVWFSTGEPTSAGVFLQAMRDELRGLGYREGQDLVIETRLVDGVSEREQQIAAEILAARPSVIVTQGRAARIVKALSPTMPVVFGFSGDPVDAGLVDSLPRPGGQFTGITFLAYELVGKRLEVLKEVLPAVRRIAVIASPEHMGEQREFAASKAAAQRLGLSQSYHPARNAAELETALEGASAARAEALVVFPDPLTNARRASISEFALRHRLPAISGWAVYADSGLLLTYGPDLVGAWRRVAYFVDRVLKGTKPSELPVELPRSLELVVNLKTARALGLSLPPVVLARASRVIE